MRNPLGILLVTGCACVNSPVVCSAQEASPADLQTSESRAEGLFESGQAHYERGEFALAAADFREAYRLSPIPELLYNLAQSERLNGECEAALQHYQEFKVKSLEPLPSDLDEKIVSMKACLENA